MEEFIRNFDEKLAQLGVSDDYRELLVSSVKKKKSVSGKVNLANEILTTIEDKLTIAPLLERFEGTTEDDWR